MAMVDDIPIPKCTLYSYMDLLIIIQLVQKKNFKRKTPIRHWFPLIVALSFFNLIKKKNAPFLDSPVSL